MNGLLIFFACVSALAAIVCLVFYGLNVAAGRALDALFEGDRAKRRYFVGLILRSPYLRRKRLFLYRLARAVRKSRAENLDDAVLRPCGLDPTEQKTVLLYYLVALRAAYIPN